MAGILRAFTLVGGVDYLEYMRYPGRVKRNQRHKTPSDDLPAGNDSPEAPAPTAKAPPVDLVSDQPPPSPLNGARLPAGSMWRPGTSQNPGGAPKGTRISKWLAIYGDMDPKDWPEEGASGLPANARIALAQLRRAMDQLDGLPAAVWAADRVEGGVDRTVHLTHKQEPTMSPEQVAAELRNAGLTGPGENLKLDEF